MDGSQFDGAAAAAFAGGGFMPSQATQNTNPAPFTAARNRETHTMIPLTVKQINQALLSNDDKVNFLIDGVDVNHVKLVGMISNKVENAIDVTIVLDDGTGCIDCNKWLNEQVDTKEMEAIVKGMYVRIHGQLRSLQGKKKLVVFGIKPVIDFDEITHHFVECIYVHSYNTKLMKQQASTSNTALIPSADVNAQSHQTAPPNQFTGQYVADGLKDIEKSVVDYLHIPACIDREKGVHQEEIAMQTSIPLDKIQEAIDSLVRAGLIYSTIDDFHYKSAING